MFSRFTIFNTPVIRPIMGLIARVCLFLAGWKIKGTLPGEKRFVLVAAPHTSNWDFVVMLLISFVIRLRVYSLMKKEMFRFPFHHVFRWLGAIPVDRSRSTNLVNTLAGEIHRVDAAALAISPAGTRSSARYWKSGFYHIARQAGVPVVLGFLDFGRKIGGIGPSLIPSGDMEADMKIIRNFYDGMLGRHPEKTILPAFPPKSAS
ncbi:MAG: glycerol acyltransferase [Desulfobacterales bacterium]|nr:MAG: glycerol acyltransferase [Desulfobacterales bacterium]